MGSDWHPELPIRLRLPTRKKQCLRLQAVDIGAAFGSQPCSTSSVAMFSICTSSKALGENDARQGVDWKEAIEGAVGRAASVCAEQWTAGSGQGPARSAIRRGTLAPVSVVRAFLKSGPPRKKATANNDSFHKDIGNT